MAQNYLNLETTPAGLNMIAKAIYGETITFTKLAIGNGAPGSTDDVTSLENPLVEVGITKMDMSDGRVILTGQLTSSDINSSFYGTELGVYAKDSTGTEILYAYRYNKTDVDYYPATSSGRVIELTFSVVIQIGSAENVTAILIEGDTYASKEAFDEHVANKTNPHNVTKEQVGLGSVENKPVNDLTPTYTEPSSPSKLKSGETISTAFGKIAAAVTSLLSHLENKDNPHKITAEQIDAAPLTHNHSAADINSGILGASRGGTGASKLQESELAKVRKATLTSSGWTSTAPYTQSITVTGIDSSMAPVISIGIPTSESSANYIAAKTSYAMIDKAVTGNGTITFTCYTSKPTADIPILIKGV